VTYHQENNCDLKEQIMNEKDLNGPLAKGFEFLSESLGKDAPWNKPRQEGQLPIWKRKKMFMEPFFTAGMVAVLLQLNLFTVYKMAKRGLIPSHKFGRSVRFRLSEVDRAIQNRRP
jgi:excisionase family DNA binding protein